MTKWAAVHHLSQETPADCGPRGQDREDYPKRPSDSIRSEEPGIGPARPNADPHGPGAFRAVPLVGGCGSVDVNPCVDATTGESDAHESTSTAGLGGGSFGLLIAGKVQVLTHHHCHLTLTAQVSQLPQYRQTPYHRANSQRQTPISPGACPATKLCVETHLTAWAPLAACPPPPWIPP